MIVSRNKRKGTKQANIWFYFGLDALFVFVFDFFNVFSLYIHQVELSEREVMKSTSPFYVNCSSISG